MIYTGSLHTGAIPCQFSQRVKVTLSDFSQILYKPSVSYLMNISKLLLKLIKNHKVITHGWRARCAVLITPSGSFVDKHKKKDLRTQNFKSEHSFLRDHYVFEMKIEKSEFIVNNRSFSLQRNQSLLVNTFLSTHTHTHTHTHTQTNTHTHKAEN